MSRFRIVMAAVAATAFATGCHRGPNLPAFEKDSEVAVETTDNVSVKGRVTDVQAETIVVHDADKEIRAFIPRARIKSMQVVGPPRPEAERPPLPADRATQTEAPARGAADRTRVEPAPPPLPETIELEVPAGTPLALRLETSVASNTSRVEDDVRATLTEALVVDGRTAVPEGTIVTGTVVEAVRSGKVKGRARLALRFHALQVGGDSHRIQTTTFVREAAGTRKDDAKKIGIPAAGGAIVGGIIGGKKGAAIGGAIGGGAGTAAVLTTRGDEVVVARGTRITVELTRPLGVEVRRTAG